MGELSRISVTRESSGAGRVEDSDVLELQFFPTDLYDFNKIPRKTT